MTEERANADLYEPFTDENPEKAQKSSGASGGGSMEGVSVTITTSPEAFDVLAGRQPSLPPTRVRNCHGTWKVVTDAHEPGDVLVTQGVDADPDWLQPAPQSFRVAGAHTDGEIIRKYVLDQFAAVMKRKFDNASWLPCSQGSRARSVGTVSMSSDLEYFTNKPMVGLPLPSDFITTGGGTIDQ